MIPTAQEGLGATAAQAYFRDLPYFVKDATTLNPYLALGTGAGMFGFQANFGAEIITNADKIEGDGTELLFKYGVTGSITPPSPFHFQPRFSWKRYSCHLHLLMTIARMFLSLRAS